MLSRVSLRDLHGIALVLFAALIPVGEGAAFAGLGLLALFTLARWRETNPRSLMQGTARSVHLGLAVWLGAGALSLILSGHGWLKPSELGLWSPFLAVPAIVISAPMLDEKWLNRAAVSFLTMLTVASVYGLVQFAMDAKPGMEWFRFSSKRVTQMAIPGSQGTIAGGFFFHRLKMAHVLLPGIGILVVRQFFAELSHRRRIAEGGVLAITVATLLLTYTRGALIAAVAGLVVLYPFASRRIRWISAFCFLLGTAAALSAPSLRQRVISIASAEASSVRSFVWSRGITILADHPNGAGLGNYPVLVGRYYDNLDPHFLIHTYPHSVVLAALAETGPVGAVGYLWAWVAVLALCLTTLRRRQSRYRVVVAAAGLYGVVAFWVVGLTHDVLFHKPVALAFAAMVGWLIAVLGRYDSADSTREEG